MHQGRLVSREGRQLLFLTGTPYEMGFQHGVLLRESIQEYYPAYWTSYRRRTRLIPGFLLRRYAHQVRQFLPEGEMEELQGIAEGADLSFHKVLLHHCSFWFPLSLRARVLGGTQFAVWGEGSAEGNMIHGRNFEETLFGNGHSFVVMVFYKPPDGYMFMTPQLAGTLFALTALNEKGITVSLSPSPARERAVRGMPAALICRQLAAHCASVQEAIDWVQAAPSLRTSGFQLMISDAKTDECVSLEMAGHKYSVVRPRRSHMIATNHFQSAALRPQQGKVWDASSTLRFDRAQEQIEKCHRRFDAPKAMELLRDHWDLEHQEEHPSPNTVCSHDSAHEAGRGGGTLESSVLCSVVVNSSRLTMWAAFGQRHAPHAPFQTYVLRDSWVMRRVPKFIPYSPTADVGQPS